MSPSSLPRPPLICFLSSLPQKPGQTHRQANTETAPDNANVSHCRRRAKKKKPKTMGWGLLIYSHPSPPPTTISSFSQPSLRDSYNCCSQSPTVCVCVCIHIFIYTYINICMFYVYINLHGNQAALCHPLKYQSLW